MGCQGVQANHVQHMGMKVELVFDRSEPPARPMHLHARQDTTGTSTTAQLNGDQASSSASSTASESAGISTATPSSQDALPTPFDSTLGNNFTSPSCPAFFQDFLSNDTFRDCLPLSLLLQSSNGFFSATKSLVRLTQTLDATCNVNVSACAPLMSSLAQQLQQDANCGSDLAMQNPTVLQAYNGLVAYQPLYQAGCLKAEDGAYCFADAITNQSAPTSSYVYYLALGQQLPSGTRPACNMCLQNTMAIFATAAGNSSVPLNDDYTSAAQQIDEVCGSQFVQASVVMKSDAASAITRPLVLVSLVIVLAMGLLA